MTDRRNIWISLSILVLIALVGWYFLFRHQSRPFKYGLDLKGGTELIYLADTSKVGDADGAMQSLREVIERRVNLFGVSEPLVQTEQASLLSGSHVNRLIVELPGVYDVEKAKEFIGKTPTLEFSLVDASSSALIPTGLTGRYLSHAQVQFNQSTQIPVVSLEFNSEGSKLFAEITKAHKGEELAIVLDGVLKSSPVIQEEIRDGKAQISGNFTADAARELVRNLNYGALPVPISFLNSETVGASLGEAALSAGERAGIIGFLALALFLILWYRLPGLVASIALTIYVIISLTIFKLIPVTLTAAGIAGFILSIGMAVDANVLIFERAKEELKKGKNIHDAYREGFHRAWASIRDSNISSMITAMVLFWLGTAAVKGFALTLGLGVLISMLTAISVSRTLLFAIAPEPSYNGAESKFKRFLFSNGFHIK